VCESGDSLGSKISNGVGNGKMTAASSQLLGRPAHTSIARTPGSAVGTSLKKNSYKLKLPTLRCDCECRLTLILGPIGPGTGSKEQPGDFDMAFVGCLVDWPRRLVSTLVRRLIEGRVVANAIRIGASL
jgi:hypothetical protein